MPRPRLSTPDPKKLSRCEQCPKTFTREVTLNEHKRLQHPAPGSTPPEPFQCPYIITFNGVQVQCPVKRAQKCNLKLHIDLVHRNICARCRLCNKLFDVSTKLSRHLKKVHKLAVTKGVNQLRAHMIVEDASMYLPPSPPLPPPPQGPPNQILDTARPTPIAVEEVVSINHTALINPFNAAQEASVQSNNFFDERSRRITQSLTTPHFTAGPIASTSYASISTNKVYSQPLSGFEEFSRVFLRQTAGDCTLDRIPIETVHSITHQPSRQHDSFAYGDHQQPFLRNGQPSGSTSSTPGQVHQPRQQPLDAYWLGLVPRSRQTSTHTGLQGAQRFHPYKSGQRHLPPDSETTPRFQPQPPEQPPASFTLIADGPLQHPTATTNDSEAFQQAFETNHAMTAPFEAGQNWNNAFSGLLVNSNSPFNTTGTPSIDVQMTSDTTMVTSSQQGYGPDDLRFALLEGDLIHYDALGLPVATTMIENAGPMVHTLDLAGGPSSASTSVGTSSNLPQSPAEDDDQSWNYLWLLAGFEKPE